MREFEILERNDHYFRCNVDGEAGKHCRIIVDDHSLDMPLGKYRLHVEEISDRYKHRAKDAVFRLTLPFNQQGSIDICTLNAGKKNQFTYLACLKLGGKWEPILNEWVFSASVKDKVDALGEIVRSKPVVVEVEFNETLSEPGKSLTLFGFELIKGLRINNAPTLNKGITLKKGDITYVGGQQAKTIVLAGSIVRLSVPQRMLESRLFREDYLCATQYKVIKARSTIKRSA
jgi:hypothetical protein